jgi:hypothetical protein
MKIYNCILFLWCISSSYTMFESCCYSSFSLKNIKRIIINDNRFITRRMEWWIRILQSYKSIAAWKDRKEFQESNSITGYLYIDFQYINRSLEEMDYITQHIPPDQLPEDYFSTINLFKDFQQILLTISKALRCPISISQKCKEPYFIRFLNYSGFFMKIVFEWNEEGLVIYKRLH